jgi:hypothetical protein
LLEDSNGEVTRTFTRIHATTKEKQKWLSLWLDIDSDKNNRMSFKEFCLYFNMPANLWTEKLFTIINHSLTGIVTFAEFLTFCFKYLVINKQSSIEFSYRLLSMSSGGFDKDKSALTIHDIKQFISYRYILKSSLIHRRSIELMSYIDRDSSGGTMQSHSVFTRQHTNIHIPM